ncbi:MAG TPA: hypothetical protein VHV10_02300 [Ktedonobacteraceae bacterium]|jgi:hypothetical protein|nr:hypothetical protein [Ktedonobacteraceae bacterium]
MPYTVIGGFDRTLKIPGSGLTHSGHIGDQQPRATLELLDPDSSLDFTIGDEVIIFDENAAPTNTLSGVSIPTVPAHNFLLNGLYPTNWVAIGSLTGIISVTGGGLNLTMAFSNSALGQGLYVQECPRGYVHVGQKYMLSIYATIATPLVNAQAQVMLQFLDAFGNALATNVLTFTSTTGNAQQRVSISAVAPADTVFVQALIGGQTTVGGSNSGSVVYGFAQLEPMWFATTQGVSYPTPDCNNAQVACAVMPDNTTSRACRMFAGTIDDIKIPSYDGPGRTWELEVAGPGQILEDGNINATFQSQYDDQIIASVITNYFPGQLNASVAPNTSSALPVIRGALIDSVSYSDNSFREVLNHLSDESGYIPYVDPYYTLRYNPSFYSASPFSLTDGVADGVTTFNYEEYASEEDGTQRKRDIKVTGGKFLAPAITDSFSANGSTSTFNLTQQPYDVKSVISNGNAQKAFFKGTGPTLGVGGYTCEIDKVNKTIHFNFNPSAGTNNVTCNYTYEAPVSVRVMDQDMSDMPVAPDYTMPTYSAKVNDTNILTIAAAIQRGLAEITKSSKPLTIKTLKCPQYIPAGYIVFFTSSDDNIINQPFVVQQVDFVYLGNGNAEYSYTLGAYRPTLIDHIRNNHKAVNRSKTTLNISNPQQTDLVFAETGRFSDSVPTFTSTPPNTSTYGTGVYGTNTYA